MIEVPPNILENEALLSSLVEKTMKTPLDQRNVDLNTLNSLNTVCKRIILENSHSRPPFEQPSRLFLALIANLAPNNGDKIQRSGILDSLVHWGLNNKSLEKRARQTLFRALANASSSCTSEYCTTEFLDVLISVYNEFPLEILIIVDSYSSKHPESLKDLVVFVSVALDSEERPLLERIVYTLVLNGFGADLVSLEVERDKKTSLLELVLAVIDVPRFSGQKQNELARVMFKYVQEASEHTLGHINSRDSEDAQFWHQRLLVCLDIMACLATSTLPRDLYGLVDTVLELLEAAKSLPKHTKLTSDTSLDPTEFPYIKSKSVALLGLLVEQFPESKDHIRESGGLKNVLEACIIDKNNPYLRESSILCIKTLLQGNPENQGYVSQLEAKGSASPEELDRAGFEVEIIDGAVKLRRR